MDFDNISEEEAEAYVRDLATTILSNAIGAPVSMFIMAAIEAAVRATMADNVDEAGNPISSVAALLKIKLVLEEVIRIESETAPKGTITH